MHHINKKILTFALTLLAFVTLAAKAEPITELLNKSSDPIAGNPKGDVTVVEFFDYQCSHCINMAPIMDTIIKDNPTVRFVFKELPIRGAASELASRAALAANKQGKYYPFSHSVLSAEQPITEKLLIDKAKDNNLNVSKLQKDMNSPAIEKQLKSNLILASELDVSGTPAFFIAKTDAKDKNEVNFQLGEMTQSELQAAINNAKK